MPYLSQKERLRGTGPRATGERKVLNERAMRGTGPRATVCLALGEKKVLNNSGLPSS